MHGRVGFESSVCKRSFGELVAGARTVHPTYLLCMELVRIINEDNNSYLYCVRICRCFEGFLPLEVKSSLLGGFNVNLRA